MAPRARLVAAVCLAAALGQPEAADAAAASLPVWPAPQSATAGGANTTVCANLTISGAATPELAAAAARFLALAFPRPAPRAGAPPCALAALQLAVADPAAPLAFGVDESYTLDVPEGSGAAIRVAANTAFGALAALQTLSQLIVFDAPSRAYVVAGVPLSVADWPAFSWRGLLVDVARHWLPPAALRAVVDSMAMAKLNVLHVHAADAQSWPFELPAFPAAWDGAFSPGERYTTDDLLDLVAYAAARGVRTVFELDHPGHLSSACKAYPALCPADCAWDAGDNSVPLSPASNDTLPFLEAALAQLAALSGDAFLHLGGDEVTPDCWQLDAAVQAWCAARGLSTAQLYAYFVNHTNAFAVQQLRRSPIRWEDAWKSLGTALDPATVVHVWLAQETVDAVVSAGYRVLYSFQGAYDAIIGYQGGWYLDGIYQPWQQMYDVDPLAGLRNATPAARALVLGGEGAAWGEKADWSTWAQTTWPRAAAIAERLWTYSANTTSASPGVHERLARFRCLLLARGVAAAPLDNLVARTSPSGPGSCLGQ